MIKFFKNNYSLKRSAYTLAVVILAILFYRFTENMQVGNAFSIVLGVLSPFIIGIIMAYILNCITNFLERRLLIKLKIFQSTNPKTKKRIRKLSILIAFIVLIGLIVGIIAYIVPEMVSSIENVANFILKIDYNDIHTEVNKFLIRSDLHISPELVNTVLSSFSSFFESLADSLKYLPNMISSVVTYSISFASSLVNVILGLMISVYILIDKEEVVLIGKKTVRALFSDKVCNKLTICIKEINHSFNMFFIGKLIDSLIIGIIYYIVSLIAGFPYPSLCALIVGICNMIPYFGPFIGAIPVIALSLLVQPRSAIWVALFIFVLQQFDGIFLGPKILGESIDLKPIGVIFAITIGGAIAGPLGMFFGVPILSVICKFGMKAIDNLYKAKHNDLPTEKKEKQKAREVSKNEQS